MTGKNERSQQPATIAAQALGWVDDETRAISPNLQSSSTFLRDADNQYRSGRNYIRADNPAFDQPEALLAQLERGEAAMLFASGMAAATAVFLSLRPGDHVIAPKVMYWSLRNWLLNFATEWGLVVDIVDMTNPDAVRAAIRPGKTKLIWAETPGNPLWDVTDLAAIAALAHGAGARFAVELDGGDARPLAADRARRRHRDAFGDEIPERTFRPCSRRACHTQEGRTLG